MCARYATLSCQGTINKLVAAMKNYDTHDMAKGIHTTSHKFSYNNSNISTPLANLTCHFTQVFLYWGTCGKCLVVCKWVFKIKWHSDSSIELYKAYLFGQRLYSDCRCRLAWHFCTCGKIIYSPSITCHCCDKHFAISLTYCEKCIFAWFPWWRRVHVFTT